MEGLGFGCGEELGVCFEEGGGCGCARRMGARSRGLWKGGGRGGGGAGWV